MNTTSVNYRVKARTRNEIYSQGSNCLSNLGDSIAWLNNRYNQAYQDSYNEDLIFEWDIIVGTENHFGGKLLLENGSFLEKILRIDLSEFQK